MGVHILLDIQAVVQAIASVGFPAVCCIYLLYYIDKLNTHYRDFEVQMLEIINELKVDTIKSIDNNTLALNSLKEHILIIDDNINKGD